MKFRRPNGGVVSFSPNAIARLVAFRQVSLKTPESGGVLLGREISESDDVSVDEVTEPHKSDWKSRLAFFRGKKAAQVKVNDAWKDSKGTRIYLGEWHTHPEDDPTPSRSVDCPDWFRIAKEAVFEQDFLLFVIVGLEKTNVWEIRKGCVELQQLKPIVEEPDKRIGSGLLFCD